jgi:DNA-binding XRE family transcriptional regulator
MPLKVLASSSKSRRWLGASCSAFRPSRLEDEFAVAAALIEARAKARLTQSELARRMGTTQSAIARLESGRNAPSGQTLMKFAKAVRRKLRVEFR